MQSAPRPSFGQRAQQRSRRPARRGKRPAQSAGRGGTSQLPAIVIGISFSLLLLGGVAFVMTRGQSGGTTTAVRGEVGAESSDPDVARLMGDLRSGGNSKRKAAASALGAMGGRACDAAPALFEAMHKKGVDILVFQAAREAIKKLGTDAIPTYIELLESENPVHRFGAADALGSLRDKGAPAVKALIATLKTDENSNVRLSAAAALGAIGAKASGAIPTLRKIVGSSDEAFSGDTNRDELRARAQQAINQISMDQ